MSLFGRSAGTDDWLAAPQGCKERLLLYSWLTIPCPPLVGLLFRQNLIQVTALLGCPRCSIKWIRARIARYSRAERACGHSPWSRLS